MKGIIFVNALFLGFVAGVYASKKRIKINFAFETEDRNK